MGNNRQFLVIYLTADGWWCLYALNLWFFSSQGIQFGIVYLLSFWFLSKPLWRRGRSFTYESLQFLFFAFSALLDKFIWLMAYFSSVLKWWSGMAKNFEVIFHVAGLSLAGTLKAWGMSNGMNFYDLISLVLEMGSDFSGQERRAKTFSQIWTWI